MKKPITLEQWESRLSQVKVPKEDMNKLVMNFLVTEVSFSGPRLRGPLEYLPYSCPALPWGAQGYVEAARMFETESGTAPGLDLSSITDRMEIRKAVQSGDVEGAVEKVNDLNPEVTPPPAALEPSTYTSCLLEA